MPRYKLTVEYHGGPFVGWQRQDVGRSVQGAIEEALGRIEPGPHRVQGAGRTDAGVHATGQVAHADLGRAWEPFRLSEALNHHLRPEPIAIVGAERAADDFHARFDAVYRRYHYDVITRRAPLTIARGLAWRVPQPLDVAAMRVGAAHLIGRHDFTTFRSAQCQAASPIKTLDRLDITETSGEIRFHLGARSFLHNQVRSIVGSLVRVGLGAWEPARIARALAAADRAECGPVAPPDGLFLIAVHFPGDPIPQNRRIS